MDAAIITQCLDIANKLNTKKAKFDINIKLEAGYFRLSSDGKYDVKEEKHWTKPLRSLKQTKRDSLRKQEFLKQKHAVQNSHDFSPVAAEDKILPKSLRPEYNKPFKTHPHENNVQCSICSFKCMNIESLDVHKKTIHGFKCPH